MTHPYIPFAGEGEALPVTPKLKLSGEHPGRWNPQVLEWRLRERERDYSHRRKQNAKESGLGVGLGTLVFYPT